MADTPKAPVGWIVVGVIMVAVFVFAQTGGGIEATVTARNVLGSYTAAVFNDTDEGEYVRCTVTASTGDTDTFGVFVGPGEVVRVDQKMPLSAATNALTITCA